jgi:hypothetical protein
MCQQWKNSVQVIPSNEPSEAWGPSMEELLTASDVGLTAGDTCYIGSESHGDEDLASESDDDDTGSSGEGDLLESIAFTDIYSYDDGTW